MSCPHPKLTELELLRLPGMLFFELAFVQPSIGLTKEYVLLCYYRPIALVSYKHYL